MAKRAFFDSIRNFRESMKQQINVNYTDKEIHDAILKTFNTGSDEYLERAYVKTRLTTEQFYGVFSNFVRSFYVRDCSTLFLKSILKFWDNHGLKAKELDIFYRKWLDFEWFLLIKEIDYKPFWKWMFTDGMDKFSVAYIIENSNVTFEDIINKVASAEEYKDVLFNRNLDKFLDSIWEAVLTTVKLPICEAIKILVNKFPDQEVKILNHAYYYFTDSSEFDPQSVTEALLHVIERMADYEAGMNNNSFSEGTTRIPYNRNAGNVNIINDAALLISKFSQDKFLKDIVWILENRFNVDEDYIEDCLFEEFFNICALHDLQSLVKKDAYKEYAIIDVLFQFSLGYRIFSMLFADILKRIYMYELETLEEKYGVYID